MPTKNAHHSHENASWQGTRFSHAAKTRKSSVSWIVRYFLKMHKITSFPIKNTIFTSFKKGQNISRMHTFHKAATTTKHVTMTAPALHTTPTTAHDHF